MHLIQKGTRCRKRGTVECSAPNGTSVSSCDSGNIGRKGEEGEPQVRLDCQRTHGSTVVVVVCMKPAQDQDRQISCIDGGRLIRQSISFCVCVALYPGTYDSTDRTKWIVERGHEVEGDMTGESIGIWRGMGVYNHSTLYTYVKLAK